MVPRKQKNEEVEGGLFAPSPHNFARRPKSHANVLGKAGLGSCVVLPVARMPFQPLRKFQTVRQLRTFYSAVLPAGLFVALLCSGASWAAIERSVDKNGVISITNSKSQASQPRRRQAESTQRSHAPDVGPSEAVMPSDESPARLTRYDEHIRDAATLYRLPEAYLRAVMQVESNYDPRAVSPAGAVGLMQLMPFTAERMMVSDIFDPRQNIMGGARYLRILANMFNGDIHLATAAYNAGENAVIRYGGIPPYEETQAYVVKVLEKYEKYRMAPENPM